MIQWVDLLPAYCPPSGAKPNLHFQWNCFGRVSNFTSLWSLHAIAAALSSQLGRPAAHDDLDNAISGYCATKMALRKPQMSEPGD